MEACGGDIRARRQRRQGENVGNDLCLIFERIRARDARDRERWIGRKTRLDHVGLGQAQFVIGGLKSTVVEERDLHRRLDGERTPQELIDARTRSCRILHAANRDDVLAKRFVSDAGNRVHPTIRRKPCARAERNCRGQNGAKPQPREQELGGAGVSVAPEMPERSVGHHRGDPD